MTTSKKHQLYNIWWLMFLAGVILLLIGSFAFIKPWNIYINLIKYSGFALVISSTLLMIHISAFKTNNAEKKWLVMESIVDLTFGLTLIFNPLLAVITFPILIGCWVFLRGVIKIIISLALKQINLIWRFILVIGIISALFGVLIITHPFESNSGISTTMNIFAIIMGMLYIYDSLKFKRMEDALIAMI